MANEKRRLPWVTAEQFHKNPTDECIVQKQTPGGVVKAEGDEDDRQVRLVISNGAVDRDNDTIAVDGWDLTSYLKNPTVLWAHDRKALPIAKALEVGVTDGNLEALAEFSDLPFANDVLHLIRGKFINASSVGFRPMEWALNEERGDGGVDFLKQELVEFSMVPVPSNPEALIAAEAAGINLEVLREWLAKTLGGWPEGERLRLPGTAWRKILLDEIGDVVDDASVEKLGIIDPSDSPTPQAGKAPVLVGDLEESLNITGHAREQLDGLLSQLDEAGVKAEKLAGALARLNAVEIPETVLASGEASPDETLRWNKQLPEEFDIAAEEFPPRSVEQAMAAKYCGCQVKELRRQGFRIASARMGAFLLAADEGMGLVAVDDVRNLDRDGNESAPVHRMIQLNSKRADTFLIDGMRFIDLGEATKMTLRVMPTWYGLAVTTYAKDGEASAASDEFIEKVQAAAAKMKLLKGEAFSLSGEFLDRGETTFDDLVLTEGNDSALRRTAQLVNEKGGALESRGILEIGPPGTGKTMSGRALMREADATFIWLSARDFYYGGGFRALESAFKLAEENAPTILFIEDVDSYLNENVTDLMKTAMDGLVQASGVVTVLTSNYPERLPAAIIDRPGRFHDVLRFDLPDEGARTKMLGLWLPELKDEALVSVVEALKGYSGAHVREFARFVGVIRDQDGLEVEAAATAALTKIQEQRDLITSLQVSGSQYRAPAHVMVKEAGWGDREIVQAAALKVVTEILVGPEDGSQAEERFYEFAKEENDGLIEFDPAMFRKAIEKGTRQTIQESVVQHTDAALDYARGRV